LNVGLGSANDGAICKYAAEHSLVIVTKDQDFSRQVMQLRVPIRVIWVRLGNCRKPTLLAEFDTRLPSIVAALAAGNRLVEIR
jgi:predicted nuclease of predicted toxin-antitoxin system